MELQTETQQNTNIQIPYTDTDWFIPFLTYWGEGQKYWIPLGVVSNSFQIPHSPTSHLPTP